MKTSIHKLAITFALLWPLHLAFPQGSLTPPGAPGPSMKTLEQIEPRKPISTLPFTISSAGSYYLTANLTGTAGQNGITITVSDVTLDLGGFTLTGVGGSLDGIKVNAALARVTVRNGVLRDWGENGLDADQANGCVFEQLRISGSGSPAVIAGFRSTVRDCTALGNPGGGIAVDYHSVISGCVSAENGGDGFSGGAGATVRDCVALNNSGHGFGAGDVSVLSGCTSRDNVLKGYELGAGVSVNTCTATANGEDGLVAAVVGTMTDFVAKNNGGRGISVGYGWVIEKCTARQNGGIGIYAEDAAVITECSARENGGDGIQALVGSAISKCAAMSNNGNGMRVDVGGSVTESTARDNTDTGVVVGTGGAVSNSAVHYNRIGISVPNNCYVINNTVYGNTDQGILVNLDNNRIDGNTITGTSAGPGVSVVGAGNILLRNTARGNFSGNYSIAANNAYGPIVNVAGVGDISGTANANHPWANFSF